MACSSASPQLRRLSSRLGVTDGSAIGKAAEFERLLKLKLSGANKISDTAQTVICLHLAAERLRVEFDTETAVKLAAVKKSAYANCKHTIEKLLNLTDTVDVNGLCVQLGCTSVRELATDILELICESSTKICNRNSPQFVCMAVYQACKIDKIKIPKQKILSYARVKPGLWNEMDTEWSKIISASSLNVRRTEKIKTDSLRPRLEPSKKELNQNKTLAPSETKEDYETWKWRILKQACEEIGDVDMELLKNNTQNKSGVVLTFG